MSSFKPLTLGRLPRVFVKILAMSAEEDREVFTDALRHRFRAVVQKTNWPLRNLNRDVEVHDLAEVFAAILDLPKAERESFAADFDRYLNNLLEQDFFGTEGQCDPRGGHRD